MNDVVSLLFTWTPFLLAGFMWNIAVTLLAVALGTAIGAGLAVLRVQGSGLTVRASALLSRIFRNVPTLAFLFFATFVLPREFTVFGAAMSVPLWFTAALGLSASVIGFTSESLVIAYQNLNQKNYTAALLFLPTWGSSVMISFIASSTASLVGVSELISRSNTIIAATGTASLIPVYLYCASFFVVACLGWMALVNRLKNAEFIRALPQNLHARLCSGAASPPPI